MSLLRLLNLGQAMPKVKGMGQYNLTKQHWLPTFGPKKSETRRIDVRPAAVAAPLMSTKTPAQPARAVEAPRRKTLFGWVKKANPFAGATGVEKAVEARSQNELALDKVKVVRSDLSESDVRVLPKAPPGSTIPAKRYVRPNVQPDELGKKAWGALGSRLFGNAAAKH